MNLKDILAKMAKGETLTEAEKNFLAEYNLQAELDAAAANARRVAERKAAEAEEARKTAEQEAREAREALEAKENEGKSELEKLQKENEKLKQQIAERDTKIAAMGSDNERLTREAKLDRILHRSGIAFIDNVDGEAQAKLFKQQFSDLDTADLDDDQKIDGMVKVYRDRNKAIIADKTGHGTDRDPGSKIEFEGKAIKNPWKKEDFNLTLQGKIRKSNPALAAKLQQEAAAGA